MTKATAVSIQKKLSKTSDTTAPRLSVIIPVYNNPEMLRKCLKSVYDSNYKNFEVIVVDSQVLTKLFQMLRKKLIAN